MPSLPQELEKPTLATTIQKYRRRLLAFVRKQVRSDEDAEDILQNVFYQLIRADSLMQPVDKVSAWLYRVAKNQIIDHSRKKKEVIFQDDDDGDDDFLDLDNIKEVMFDHSESAEDIYTRQLFWKALENALAELPQNQRLVFEKTELHGYTFKMLSEETGVAVNTLLSRKRYAVSLLRKRLRLIYIALMDD